MLPKTDMTPSRHTNSEFWIGSLLVMAAVAISLLGNWEPSVESWGYWLFSRVFSETGQFFIPDRSPFYTLYILLFRWIGFPGSMIAEYTATMVFTVLSLALFARPYLGWWVALFFGILWIPFLQESEPPVQNLALGFSCLAVYFRAKGETPKNLTIFYLFLGLAYLFRVTYSAMVLIFLAWDTATILRARKRKPTLTLSKSFQFLLLPALVIGLLVGTFRSFQSSHHWNNAWYVTTDWYPDPGKSLISASIFESINIKYVQSQPPGSGTPTDMYFSNPKLFGENSSLGKAILKKPEIFLRHWKKNLKELLPMSIAMTQLFRVYSGSRLANVFFVPFFAMLFLYAFLFSKNRVTQIFILGSFGLLASTALAMPKMRYMTPFIPVLGLCSAALAHWVQKKLGRPSLYWVAPITGSAFVFVFSQWPLWTPVLAEVRREASLGQFHVLEKKEHSMTRAYFEFKKIDPARNCRGIISLEYSFMAAFLADVPLDRIHDHMEIPPFGSFQQSKLDILRPARINCLFLSHWFQTGNGGATNLSDRYGNFLAPYANLLMSKGATTLKSDNYGKFVILKPATE